MKKIYLLAAMLLLLLCPSFAAASEVSSDKMIMDWTTSKVWMVGENLCIRGTFVNKRSDLTVTKLNEFNVRITFTKEDGTEYQFVGQPVKLPMCKVLPSGSKALTLNFGKFDGTWKKWVTAQDFVFTYIDGARF